MNLQTECLVIFPKENQCISVIVFAYMLLLGMMEKKLVSILLIFQKYFVG
jgi:hypothetical protein